MKRAFCALSIFLLSASASFAQSTNPGSSTVTGQNSFFAELGGPGVLFSANIDRRFNKSRLGWGGRVGLGFVTSDFMDDYNGTYYNYSRRSVLTVPVQINYIFGKGTSPHTFEAGAGFTVLSRRADVFNYYDSYRGSRVLGTAAFMYRRQPVDGGFSWRIGFTPVFNDQYIQASGGVGVGYNF